MSSKMTKRELVQLARTTRSAPHQTDEAIRQYLSSLDCPRSLAVYLLYSNGEHDQLANLSTDPDHFNDPSQFRDAYAATLFLSKSDFLRTTFDRKEEALKKFLKFEELCKHTNDRFRNLSLDPLYQGSNVWLLQATTRKIEQILGDFSGDEFVDAANWGPGVSTLVKGAEVSAFNKFHAERGITRDLYRLVSPFFLRAYPLWGEITGENLDSFFSYEVGNKIVTVPKNSKADRVIAIEPGFNIFFQKAVGAMIRRRLRRVGIDLNSQVRNQQLAKASSLTYRNATVDFSSASDSISESVVRELVPARWLTLMDSCRSRVGMHENSVIRWQKFSAMGNGFTFELESLIFYAAALAVCDYLKLDSSEISVFGDDVIIPVEAYSLFQSFSEFLGFRVNMSKSFAHGNFRESCGSHYYSGTCCKPVFLKERISNVESFYKLANAIRAYAHRRSNYCGCDSKLRQCWLYLLRGIPKPLRFGVPLGLGDVGIMMNFDESCQSSHGPVVAGRGFEGYRIRILSHLGVTREADSHAILMARLWSPSVDMCRNLYTLRGKTRIAVNDDVLVHQWYNLGSWM